MGVVWLARDELLHRDVAVKEIAWPPDLPSDERDTLRERAMGEARNAARLDHPNVVRVFDVAEHDDRPWIVMQLLPYRSLGDLIRENGPVMPERAARIGLDILAAITAAHAAGVLHRDVKPDNVLLDPDDKAVLTDFGLAVADGSTRVTTSGLVIGSPAYMPPERVRGERATIAADLWSFGATLYAAVEGRAPFERNGTLAVLAAIANDEPDPPVRAGSMWPVISELLSKDPAARPRAVWIEPELSRVAGDPRSRQSALPEHLTAPLPTAEFAPQLPLIPALQLRSNSPAPVPASAESARPGRRAKIAAVFAGLVALAGIAIGLVYSSAGAGRPAANGQRTGQQHASRTSGPTPTESASAKSPAGARTGGVNTSGYVGYSDPSGFSIKIPAGWHVSHSGHLVYIQPAGGGTFLLIDQTDHPQRNALADWRQQEANRISTYPGYHRIRLAAVQYAPAEQAADWEFTYYDNGRLTHVLNRNVLVNNHLAYALYWSTPQPQWSADYHYFRVFAATFRPASPPQR